MVNAGVIDADYTGELGIVLAKLGNQEFAIQKETE